MGKHDHLIGTILGSYTLTRVLGVGGMGAVYLGEHPEIESKVAIKLLLPEFVQHEEVVKLFLDEARAVNRIGHPGIIRIHDSARHEKLGVFLVMEYLEGETLYQLHHRSGPLEPALVCRLLQQAASALEASHQVGIVHRDLKPANLFLVADPEVPGGMRVKVLDFGIAKLVEGRDPMSGATETGAFLGSPMFMSPEQCLDSKEVDHRTDIYALGAIGYHVLSGRYPYEAPSIGRLILMHQNEKPPPLRELNQQVPEPVQVVLDRALETERERRYQSMAELREALLGVLGQSTGPHPVPRLQPTDSAPEALPPTVCDPVDEAPAEAGQARPPSTTTLSRAAGEQTAQAAAELRRPFSLWIGIGLSVLAVVVAAVLLLRSSGPEPEKPKATAARPGPATRPTPASAPVVRTPDAAAIRQVTVRLEVSPPSATLALDGETIEQHELKLPADGRERRLVVSAPGHAHHEERFTPERDLTLRVRLRRERAPAPKKAATRTATPKSATPKPKKPATKKPYFDDL